jgi:flagellar hook-length control protein FliK
MNATPRVSQTPIASDPAQQSSAASVNSVKSGADGQDFAAALGNAGPKSIRKAAGHKPADVGSAGGLLPAPGNLSPPPTSPVVAGSAAALAAATVAGTRGIAAKPGTAGGAAAVAAASTAAVGTASISGAQAKMGDQSSGSASGSPTVAPGAQGAMPSGTAATPNGDGAAASGTPAGIAATAIGAATAASTAEVGAGAGAPATTGTAAAASNAGNPLTGTAAAASSAGKPVTGAAATASSAGKPLTGAATASNLATSGRTSATDGSTTPSTNTGAWISTDPTAQAVTAAAMSAAATGAVAPGDPGFAGASDSPSTPTVDLATPAKGAAGPNGPPVPARAISVARAAAAVSAKAAAAPAGTTLADASAADKRAPGGTGDALLSGMPGDAMAGAAQLSVGANGVTDATPTPTVKVSAGVDTPEFGQGLADRVSWMVDNNLNGAKLQVNPPQLGPIEVRIAVQGNHAQVWLTSHSAVTRDALESSSPKLREMLGAQGFGQVSVDISQRSFQERSAFSQPYQWTPSASPSSSTAAVQSTASSLPRLSSGAVDAYA